MTEYPNSGALFKNDKQGNESAPDYKGSAVVDGTEWWISSWIKTGAKGKFMSLSFTAKEADKSKPAPRKPVASEQEDCPF